MVDVVNATDGTRVGLPAIVGLPVVTKHTVNNEHHYTLFTGNSEPYLVHSNRSNITQLMPQENTVPTLVVNSDTKSFSIQLCNMDPSTWKHATVQVSPEHNHNQADTKIDSVLHADFLLSAWLSTIDLASIPILIGGVYDSHAGWITNALGVGALLCGLVRLISNLHVIMTASKCSDEAQIISAKIYCLRAAVEISYGLLSLMLLFSKLIYNAVLPFASIVSHIMIIWYVAICICIFAIKMTRHIRLAKVYKQIIKKGREHNTVVANFKSLLKMSRLSSSEVDDILKKYSIQELLDLHSSPTDIKTAIANMESIKKLLSPSVIKKIQNKADLIAKKLVDHGNNGDLHDAQKIWSSLIFNLAVYDATKLVLKKRESMSDLVDKDVFDYLDVHGDKCLKDKNIETMQVVIGRIKKNMHKETTMIVLFCTVIIVAMVATLGLYFLPHASIGFVIAIAVLVFCKLLYACMDVRSYIHAVNSHNSYSTKDKYVIISFMFAYMVVGCVAMIVLASTPLSISIFVCCILSILFLAANVYHIHMFRYAQPLFVT